MHFREPGIPSMKVPAPARSFSSHHDMPFGRSPSMPINRGDAPDDVPPPLPPPRNPFGTNAPDTDDALRHSRDRAHPVSSLSSGYGSGYGSAMSSFAEDRFRQRMGSNSHTRDDRDEGYSSWHSNERYLALCDLWLGSWGLPKDLLTPAVADYASQTSRLFPLPFRTPS